MSRLNFKEGAVVSTEDEVVLIIEKLVFLPVKIEAFMGASVDKGVEFTVLVNDKNVEQIVIIINLK